MHVSADGKCDGFARGNGALSEIRSEANGLAVMPGAGRVGQLWSFGRDCAQFEGAFAPQQDAYQLRAQKQTYAVSKSLNHRRSIRAAVKDMGYISENFSATVLLPGSFA